MAKPVELNIDARDFRRVMRDAKAFDKALYANLRIELRAAARDAADDVKAAVRKPPAQHAGRVRTRTTLKATKRRGSLTIHRGLRESMADGVKVEIAAGRSKVGVYIKSTGGNVAAGKVLKRKWDSPTGWRHPVFAGGRKSVGLRAAVAHNRAGTKASQKTVWVDQFGNPYFGTIIEKHAPKIETKVRAALDKAAKAAGSTR